MKIAGHIFLLLCLSGLCESCGGRKSVAAESGSTPAVTDTVEAEIALPALSDTPLATAARVKFKVDTLLRGVSPVIEPKTDLYASAPGHLTFRGGLRRDADFGGTVSGRPDTLKVAWTFTTRSDMRETGFGRWGGGTGWTGQPLYVEWPDSCVARFRADSAVTASFSRREIMAGSLASHVYFVDFETGRASRNPIFVDNPVKGTISLDPTLNGSLYVGMGVAAQQPMGTRTLDLHRGAVTFRHGNDPRAWRGWHAYDSSPVRLGQFLFHPSENGTLYKFLVTGPGELELHSTMRYTVNGVAPGMEASMSVYRNYGYTADNHGNLICTELNSLRPIWHASLGDDIDATPVVCLEGEGEHPYVYVGCEVDRSGRDFSEFMKIDGITGDTVWHHRIPGHRFEREEKHFDGGYYATALPGRGNCRKLIFTNVVKNTAGQNGAFVAFDRESGDLVYEIPLACYAWSSPVGFMNERGEMFVVTADCAGRLYLIDGLSGEIICHRLVGSNFESSPVVVGNSLVVGSRGDKIFKIDVE